MIDTEVWIVADVRESEPGVWTVSYTSVALRALHESRCIRLSLEPPFYSPHTPHNLIKSSRYISDFRDMNIQNMYYIGISSGFRLGTLDEVHRGATAWVLEDPATRSTNWAGTVIAELVSRSRDDIGARLLEGWREFFRRRYEGGWVSYRHLGLGVRMERENEVLAQYRWWSYPEQRWINSDEFR